MLRFKLPLIILLSALLVASSARWVSTDDGKKMPLSDVPTKGLKAANKTVPGGEIKKEEESEKRSVEVWDFEKEQVGKIAQGFKSYRTGKGKLGVWKVFADNKNKVLAQMSKENSGRHFNLAVAEDGKYSDLQLSVKFKGVEGKEDQGGGPVWRYRDENNYYIARANPLEDNFRVYKVVDGQRKQLASKKLKVTSGEWHTIGIVMQGDHIQCSYDGKLSLDVRDNTFELGKFGLWTKADAVTYFDDLKVVALSGKKDSWSFDTDALGQTALGFRIAETAGKGNIATWQVIKDATAPSPPNVFALIKTENRSSTFNLVLAEETSYTDVDISVRVKAISGVEDQGGGPIWRALDANNYYIARWNPLEDNVRVYFVKNGRRKQLGSANVKVPSDQWHTIRILMVGQNIEAYFNGKKLITVEDGTFAEAGMVGLWTKADAATSFDDFSVKPIQ